MSKQSNMEWIGEIVKNNISFSSFITNMPPDAALTAKFATISNVTDPLLLGRVKLTFESENNAFETSEWCYVVGHPGGNLSTDYIGQKCLVVFESGDQNKAIVLGFIPVAGKRAIGSPVKLPILGIENNSPTGKIPECNESNLGSIIMLEEQSGTNQRICRRDDSGSYAWMGSNSPQVIQTNTVEAKSPEQKIGDPIGNYVPGDIFVRKTCERDQFVPYISDYSAEGQPRYKPLVSAPVYSRATVPDCNSDFIGSMGLFDDGTDTFMGICGRKNGLFKWLTTDSREPIRFAEPFASTAESVEFITSKTNKCTNPSQIKDTGDGENPGKDTTGRQLSATLSEVPEIGNKLNLTEYINTDGFKNILSDQMEARNSDKGARDRASLLATQINQAAFRVTDNNITAIEKYLIANYSLQQDVLIPILSEILRELNRTAEIGLNVGGALPSRSAQKATAPRVTLLSTELTTKVNTFLVPELNKYQTNFNNIVKELIVEALEPGEAGANIQISGIGNPDDIGIDPPEVPQELNTEQYKLDEEIEKEEPEGTQIGPKPFNALKSALSFNNLDIGEYIDSLGDSTQALNKITQSVTNVFKSNIPEEVSTLLDKVRQTNITSLDGVLQEVLKTAFGGQETKFTRFVTIRADGKIVTKNFDQVLEELRKDLTPQAVQQILSNRGSLDDPVFLMKSLERYGTNLGFTDEEIRRIGVIRDFALNRSNLSIGDIGLGFIKDLISSLGVQSPIDNDVLDFIGSDPEKLAETAAKAFFSPKNNKGNYGELVALMDKSDANARNYIKILGEKIAGLDDIPQDNLNESIKLFREKIADGANLSPRTVSLVTF